MTRRIEKIKETIRKEKFDALLISSTPNITYLTGFSHFSKDEQEAYLFITKDKQYIVTDGRYSEAVVENVKHFQLIERTIKNSLDKIFKNLSQKYQIKKLGIEEDNLSVSEYKLIKKYYDNTYHYSVSLLRMIKDNDEVLAIEHACSLGDAAFAHVLKKLKRGITERKLASELTHFIKKHDADISFPPIVAFGKNSSIPHHQTGNTKLKEGSIVLLDFGVKLDNYCSDMTRTIFFGSKTAEFEKMYQTVYDAQQKAIEYLKMLTSDGGPERNRRNSSEVESIKAKDVDKVARDYIIDKGYPTIPHSLGHGIGLEVHELPRLSPNSKDILKEGMVFSVEPGIYIPGFGGIRIEDLVVLEESGPRLLTKSPRKLILV